MRSVMALPSGAVGELPMVLVRPLDAASFYLVACVLAGGRRVAVRYDKDARGAR